MKRKDLIIAPSILAGDFGRLAEEAKRIEEAGADYVHVDIMDGHFVPNLSMGPAAVAAINKATDLFLDVHIMIYNPYDYVERFAEAGADRLTFHFEATEQIEETLEYIRKCNIQAGLAFSPETSVDFVFPFLTKCDLVLLMSVHPGFGGQSFMPEVVEKVKRVREFCEKEKIPSTEKPTLPFPIEVDGGIDAETAKECVDAGANVLVAGTYLFKDVDMKEGIERLRACGEPNGHN